MNDKKKIYIILGIFTLILVVLGGTYAWVKWSSNTKTSVTFEIGDLGITYIGDENVLNKKLYPTIYMDNTDNIIHTFSLVATANTTIYTKISLDIIDIDEELKDVSFSWKLYKGSSVIGTGNFATANIGDNILLTPYEIITKSASNYTLYIWIDGTMDNLVDMGGRNFNFKLRFEGGQEDYATSSSCFTFSSGTISDYLCTDTDIIIPSSINGVSVTKIGSNAFASNGLTSVVIPNTVTTIEYHAFRNNSISSLTIGNKVKTIGQYAFSGNKLTYVYLPASVTSLGTSPFYNNSTLEGIKVDDGNTTFDSRDNSNAIIKKSNNQLISGCKNTIIPSTVTSIGAHAFRSMGMSSVVIPDSVTSIGDYAFHQNSTLTSLVLGSGLKTIGSYSFASCGLTSLVIPNSVTSVGSNSFNYSNISSLTLGNSLTTIGESAFQNNNIVNVVIPNSVTTIGSMAFNVNSLTTVTIGSGVTSIGSKAFYSTSSSNKKLTTIRNLTGSSFDWNLIITGTSGTSFTTGSVTANSRTISIVGS